MMKIRDDGHLITETGIILSYDDVGRIVLKQDRIDQGKPCNYVAVPRIRKAEGLIRQMSSNLNRLHGV